MPRKRARWEMIDIASSVKGEVPPFSPHGYIVKLIASFHTYRGS
jgi:hypothetical protein